jgi:hypothetical protein
VLQTLDVISLALSLVDPAVAGDPDAEPPSLSATLFQIEQQPGGRILPSVPTAPLGQHLDLRFSVPEPGAAAIDPWPFAEPSFAIELPSRTLPSDGLDEAEAGAAYRAAPVEPIRWTLRAG